MQRDCTPLARRRDKTTVPAMIATMVFIVPEPTGYAGIRHVPVSLPRIACLVDHGKYLEPGEVPEPETRDLRRLRRDKGPRAPSLRVLVRWALRCDNAEQLGLRQSYERHTRRAGITGRSPQADTEDRRSLKRLLNDAMG